MTLANKITIARIVLIPPILVGFLLRAPVWPVALFVLSALSDVLDGAVARLRGERTPLGSLLDPIADKLLLISSFMALVHLDLVPVWAFVVVFSRDLLVFLGWGVIYILTRSAAITPRWLGKFSTLTQMLSVIALLAPPLAPLREPLLWTMLALTSLSTLDYVWVGAKRLNQLG